MLTPLVLAGGTGDTLWEYIHPNAKVLIGIHWPPFQHSSLAAWAIEKALGGETEPVKEFLDNTGEVLISSPGALEDQAEPPLLIAVQGSFDLSRVQMLLERSGRKKQLFGSVAVYRPKEKASPEPAFALPAKDILLIADGQSLFQALERLHAGGPPENPLIDRARVLAAKYDAWLLAPEPGLMRHFLLTNFPRLKVPSAARNFEAGLSIQGRVAAIEIALDLGSETAARMAAANLQSEFEPKMYDRTGALNRVKNVSASRHGTAVRFAISIEPAVPAPQARPSKVIRIEGLDSGPREIPLGP